MKLTSKNLIDALKGSLADYRTPRGLSLLDRILPYFEWQDNRRYFGLWPYSKASLTTPKTQCTIQDDAGNKHHGVNFASQDYLSLASHPLVHDAAIKAIRDFGVHSAGSATVLGKTHYSLKLEKEISDFLKMEHVQLFPTGWGAGYGIITALVRSDDYVVMDILTHACLQAGAKAATKNIFHYRHNNIEHLQKILIRIRKNDVKNAILVVTEGLFSMDSDYADIKQIQDVCKNYNATLVVDVAHDLGATGPGGTGTLGILNVLGQVDLVMGSFSKTFASNGGFVATSKREVKEYLVWYSSPQTFSNALSPIQAAIVLKAMEVVRSDDGEERRIRLTENVLTLRECIIKENINVLGVPSAIVPAIVGNESLLRLASRYLTELEVLTNLVEYPAVPRRAARFRFQVMADHTPEQAKVAASRLGQALKNAKIELDTLELSVDI